MTAETTAPMTAEQARARLDELTRFPGRDDPAAARRLAAAFGALAERRAARFNLHLAGQAPEPPPWTMLVMSLETVAMVLLMALDAEAGRFAASLVWQILDAWDAEEAMGGMLRGHLAALGVDAGEISLMEAAAKTEQAAAAPLSPADASLRIVREIIRATLSRLASDVPVADDGAETAARLRYAVRTLEDIEAVTGTAGEAAPPAAEDRGNDGEPAP